MQNIPKLENNSKNNNRNTKYMNNKPTVVNNSERNNITLRQLKQKIPKS